MTGFWFTQELKSKNTLIAVPSLSLIKQTLDVYLREIVANKKKVKWLCICSDDGIGRDDDIVFKTENIGVPCQTDPLYIENWLKENKNENKIIFTTYQSGKIIAELSKKLKMSFDLGIFDEAHKTVGSSKKLFSHLLFEKNISIEKRIFMTATERFYAGSKDDIISMDDIDIYGDTFSMMSFKEAIDAKLLTDYKIITIDIKQSELSEFIKENRNVEFSGDWDKDVKSRSLASMLALRKAMKRFPIKNAVSFHSSIKQAKINEELQDYISDTYKFEPIDTFTVSGKIPTTKRNDIVQEFAKSKKALITNARCLTEGVDVPNIDCIVFADPRRSKVDIVQALGRALRTKEGKDWGYVILPVIYDDKTNEIDNDNFNEILSVVRGLAANDERIVDYFKFKESERIEKSKAGERIFNFEVFSEYIDESELKENLQIKLWDKLSRFQWMPFEEARKYVWSLNLRSREEWDDYNKSAERIPNIPTGPWKEYKDKGWLSIYDWLGTAKGWDGTYFNYEKSKKIVRKLKLKSPNDWRNFDKNILSFKVPNRPSYYYKNSGWISWGDFLGYKGKRTKENNYNNYEDAIKYIHKLKLKSSSEWKSYSKSDLIPSYIPKDPRIKYKYSGWISMGDWLGTGKVADQNKTYLSFEKARRFVRKLNLNNKIEWIQYVNTNKIQKIPKSCNQTYENDGWLGWKDFLGTVNKKKYNTYDDAKKWALKNDIKTKKDWKNSGIRPSFFPANPDYCSEYKDKWSNWEEFLEKKVEYLDFISARKFVHNLNLKNQKEWQDYVKSKKIPLNIHKSPARFYKNKGWVSMGDWLGTGKVADHLKVFKPFSEVKDIVKKLGLKSQKEWYEFTKSEKKPIDVPYKPYRTYKNEWIDWYDFLGKEKK